MPPTPDEDDEKTRIIRRPPPAPSAGDDDETVTTEKRARAEEASDEENEMTRIVGPVRRSKESAAEPEAASGESDPVVGWLIVLAGPGRGNAVKLGYGQNSIGRDRGERTRIDFGDPSISRSKHCFVIYEPRKREFILRPGDSANLTYLNGDLVSEPKPLPPNGLIEIGNTTLRFIALCGPDFDWQDEPPKKDEKKK